MLTITNCITPEIHTNIALASIPVGTVFGGSILWSGVTYGGPFLKVVNGVVLLRDKDFFTIFIAPGCPTFCVGYIEYPDCELIIRK